MYSTSFRPTPYRDLHLGGLFNAYMNWLEARESGGEFVLIADDLWVEIQGLWSAGFPVPMMVERYVEDLSRFGMRPDRIEYSLTNRERHEWAVRKLGMRPLEQPRGLGLKKNLGGPCSVVCNFGDRPWLATSDAEGWLEDAAYTMFYPAYMACCLIDDIDFGITKWIGGFDLLPLWAWCVWGYRSLGYIGPEVQFHPALRRSRAQCKFSKSDASTLTLRQLFAVGYEPEAILETLRECAYRSWEKGLQAITIPPDVLVLDEVRTLKHRNRSWEQLARGEFEPGNDSPPGSEEYIMAEALRRLAWSRASSTKCWRESDEQCSAGAATGCSRPRESTPL